LQLGIGIILFIIPGACLYGIIQANFKFSTNDLVLGFVISHLLIAVIGTLGRLSQSSFQIVELFFILTGFLVIVLYSYFAFQKKSERTISSLNVDDTLQHLLLLLIAVVVSLVVIQRVLNDDDLTYLAYLTNWQHASQINFNDIIFGEAQIVSPRFWIMSAPFAQALLAEISHIPGILLISGYYEPFLVILSVLSWYQLLRTMGLSARIASAATMLNLTFLLLLSQYLHPGGPFFRQLSSDKAIAAYIIAPVFFQSIIELIKNPSKNNLTIFALTGFSLTFMHPVILAYSIFIGGMLILFNWKKLTIKELIITLLIFAAILLHQITLRFIDTPGQPSIPFDTQGIVEQSGLENMITRWGDSPFYGFNPNVLNMKIPLTGDMPLPSWILRAWVVIPILSVMFAIKQIKQNFGAQFLLASFLLAALAGFPLTGWIIGYFLSAYMLERALWLFPFGFSAIYAFTAINGYISQSEIKPLRKIQLNVSPNGWFFFTTAISISIFVLYMYENSLPDIETFTSKMQRYNSLANAGQLLDQSIDNQAYIIGSPQINDLIPGISVKAKIITFRISSPSNMLYFSNKERLERIADTNNLFSKEISTDERLAIIKKYNIQYLFLQSFDLQLFEELMTNYPYKVKKLETKGVIVLQIDQ